MVAECNLISGFKHRNVGKLLGYCHEIKAGNPSEGKQDGVVNLGEETQFFLVLEYMPSLYSVITGKYPHKLLLPSFISREILLSFLCLPGNSCLATIFTEPSSSNCGYNFFLIIKGIAEGLLYLHETKHVIHLNLRPKNILLDSRRNPIICDFGRARVFSEHDNLRAACPAALEKMVRL